MNCCLNWTVQKRDKKMFGLTFALLAIALAIIYFYVKYFVYSYWHRRGIPYLKPSFPLGNCSKLFMPKLPFGVQLDELYRSTSEPFVGIFVLHKPFLLIRDTNLIRSILITDFQYFTDRDTYLNEKDDPLTGHLGALEGKHWYDMRKKLTPSFNPNKMKMIFPTLRDCGKQLLSHLSKVNETNKAIEMCEITACCISNIIASIIFGIEIDCLSDPNHPFRNAVRQVFDVNVKNGLRFIGLFLQPTLLKWSGLRFVDRAVEEYFFNLVADTLKMRETNNIERNDLLQSLIKPCNDDIDISLENRDEQKSMSIEQVVAQVFFFSAVGVDTIALTATGCLSEIAKNPDIQRKIHAEIEDIMAQHNGLLTYESTNELKYLDCCIDETLRKYQFPHLNRVCVKDYKIPGTNITLEKGTSLSIPTFALHHDEKFFPDPDKFDPTRFCSENKADKNLINMPFLAFGDGPRNCIGRKMAKIFSKVVICSVLQQYHVELDDRHIGKEMQFSVNFHPIGGIHLKLKAK